MLEHDAQTSLAEERGLYERELQPSAAAMTVRTASVEPLAIHFAVVSVAILVGIGLLEGFQGIALDLLIVSALATLSIQAIADNLVPFLLLAGFGLAWNVAVFALLAQRMIPRFWCERGIGDLGQSLGVTATGLILIRVADPDTATPALEAFGYKQLAFEPFFGGGLITAAALPLIAQFGALPLLIGMSVLLVLSVAAGVLYFGKQAPAETSSR